MNRIRIILPVLTGVLLAGCTVPTGPAGPAEASGRTSPRVSVGAPQKTTEHTVTVAGRDRHYRVSTPDGFYRGRQWPLLFAFHGWGESATHLEEATGLDEADAIVIYPEGVGHAWAPAPYAQTTGEEDLAFIRVLLDDLISHHPVDPSRVFATGFSNGGGFAAYLGCRMPEDFHAVVPVGAAYYDSIHVDCSERPVARLDIHGTDDEVISYYGGQRHGTRYEGVPEVLDRVATVNGCTGASVSRDSAGDGSVIVQNWQGCRMPLVHLRVGGGTHEWPSAATDEVLRFLSL